MLAARRRWASSASAWRCNAVAHQAEVVGIAAEGTRSNAPTDTHPAERVDLTVISVVVVAVVIVTMAMVAVVVVMVGSMVDKGHGRHRH